MPRVFKAAGKMNLDRGGSPGDHLWVVKNMFLTQSGYEVFPEKNAMFTFGSGETPQGIFHWTGSSTSRVYAALSSTLWELTDAAATDVSGSAYTNTTNGVSFAAYGEFCFASNGVNDIQSLRVPASTGGTDNFSDMVYTTGGAEIAPKYICSHKNHLIGANITMRGSYGQIATHTTAVGAAFTNQPANDGVEAVSSNAGDTTQTLVIYGTRTGQGDTLYQDNIALNGVTQVNSIYTDWALILATKVLGTTAGTVTVREASGNATITTMAPGANPTSGVSSVAAANQAAGGQLISIVSDGATTRQVGLYGLNYAGVDTIDSQALSGTTVVQTNIRFNSMLEVFIGDVENTRTVTLTSYQYASGSEFPYMVWISGTDDPEGFATPVLYPQIVGSDNYQLFDGKGKITGIIDGGDCFFVFKEGSIHRFDGPPFEPTVISYTVGMFTGTTPYRQDDRIYFWGISGLSYIDINTNQITHLFEGRMLRSVTDYANENFGFTTGSYPAPDEGALARENVVSTNERVSISGDTKYGFVLMSFTNGSLGGGKLLYQAKEDCFAVLDDPATTRRGILVEVPTSLSGLPYPGSALRDLSDSGASNSFSDWNLIAIGDRVAGSLPYMRFPFDRFGPADTKGHVVRVRPVFMNPGGGNDPFTGSFAAVISASGVARSWSGEGIYRTSIGGSADGWMEINDPKVADLHSIGVVIDSNFVSTFPLTHVADFVGIDVEFSQAPGRSL